MNNHVRKVYLHLDHPGQKVDIKVGKLDARTVVQGGGCTHYLHFSYSGMYTRVWVNLKDIQLKRDLRGLYLMDFREEPMMDRVVCTKESRSWVSRIRPEMDNCIWRDEPYQG